MEKRHYGILSLPVIVGALGYFVDIYDLLLFNIIRVKSLKSLGLSADEIKDKGIMILNAQMIGLLIGGIIWGSLGDKKGRLKVLFGSIILYSLANIANGFVTTVPMYALMRFIAGLGLAGELGAGITLVAELLPKEKRGVGTSLVAGIGLFGAVAAYFVSSIFQDWHICFFVAGGLGFLLLLLRLGVMESDMFKGVEQQEKVSKGNFFLFFTNLTRFRKYLFSILLGLPTWYIIGILVSFSKEMGEAFKMTGPIDPGKAVMCAYMAIAVGDVLIGFISQWFKSRKKAIFLFYGLAVISVVLYFQQYGGSATSMYVICAFMGFSTGFWAIFVTIAAEQFGTNLRATAATTVPNMVRGSLVGINYLFKYLAISMGIIKSGWITGIIVFIIGVIALTFTEETFHKDLDYIEQ
jgi:putative MFS transporter